MLQISYQNTLPCPVYVILSQYYDSEHISTVHPKTLGEVRMVDVLDEGREVIYDHLWSGRRRRTSRVCQRYFSPLTMEFDFLSGRYRGTRVRTVLTPQGKNSTLVDETYFIPGFPNWKWLARLVRPLVMKKVNAIWKEDLDVGVCIGGWPGMPACARVDVERQEMEVVAEVTPVPLTPEHIPEGQGRCYSIEGRAAAVFNVDGKLHALSNRCPHTGGPLSLGRVTSDKKCVECPWHAARFDLATGEHTGGPGSGGVEVIALPAGDSV